MSRKLSWLLILAFVPFAIACGDDDNPNPKVDTIADAGVDMSNDMVQTDDTTPGGDSTPAAANFEKIQGAATTYLAWAAPSSFVFTAPTLQANLSDGDATNDPYILSVRAADHYALGHVPGAVNIPWKTIPTADLSNIPTDKEVDVYCYTGHTGQIATTALGMMGYDTRNMKFGMTAWTKNAEVRATKAFSEDTDANDFTTETTANTVTDTFAMPDLSGLTGTEANELIKSSYTAWVDAVTSPVIKATDLQTNLADGDTTNDPQIISVRKAEHYALGHIPGAINIPWADIAKPENLAMIDPSKPVVVYCYTGHTGQIATTVLGLLGYKAQNIKHGIMAWTKDTTVRAVDPFSETSSAVGDFPFEGTATP